MGILNNVYTVEVMKNGKFCWNVTKEKKAKKQVVIDCLCFAVLVVVGLIVFGNEVAGP